MVFGTTSSHSSDAFRPALIALLVALLLGIGACRGELNTQGAPLSDGGADVVPDDLDVDTSVADTSFASPDAADALDAPIDAIDDGNDGATDEDAGEDTGEDIGPTCHDPDGDRYGHGEECLDFDCDQSNAAVHPGQPEACNGIDDNCDAVIDEGCRCNFSDSANGVCAGSMRDANGTCSQPPDYEADESSCDSRDNDCDGTADEGCPCNYTNSSDGVCAGSTRDAGGNCQMPSDYEASESSCDSLDNDCDGTVDEGCATTSCTDNDNTCPTGCARANDNDCALDCRDPLGWPTSWANFEDQVFLLSNQHRAAGATCGSTYYPAVPPLTFDSDLREAARCHSMDMGLNNYFSHTDLNGGNFSDRATAAGYSDFPSGENISAGRNTPTEVVNAWMASEGHCKNIMRSNNEELGVGFFYDSNSHYGEYWTQVFGIVP